jgi:hypothetical protein
MADYDTAANEILKTPNHYQFEFIWGAEEYWKRLHAKGNFFATLPLMPDAKKLWNRLKEAGEKPEILTALPKTNGEVVDKQKRRWVKDTLDHTAVVHTCLTHEKPNYCQPGDVLIDDRAINRAAWTAKGGIYIIHNAAWRTIGTLEALGIIK